MVRPGLIARADQMHELSDDTDRASHSHAPRQKNRLRRTQNHLATLTTALNLTVKPNLPVADNSKYRK
jgi:hypothetical protein